MVDWDAAYTGGTNLIVTALIPSTTYNFQIASINSVGTSTLTSVVQINTSTNATVPDPPTALTKDIVNTNASQVALQWTAPTNNGGSPVIGYKIWWDAGTGGAMQV